MPRHLGYKNKGDRVIVINPASFGKHGTVRVNDGFGEVLVDLDDGHGFHGYEGRDLIYEDEPVPEKAIPADPSGPSLGEEVVVDERGNSVGILCDYTGGKVVD